MILGGHVKEVNARTRILSPLISEVVNCCNKSFHRWNNLCICQIGLIIISSSVEHKNQWKGRHLRITLLFSLLYGTEYAHRRAHKQNQTATTTICLSPYDMIALYFFLHRNSFTWLEINSWTSKLRYTTRMQTLLYNVHGQKVFYCIVNIDSLFLGVWFLDKWFKDLRFVTKNRWM